MNFDSKIRELIELQLALTPSNLSTAFENVNFTPVANVPYQRVTLMPARPENPVMDSGFERGVGIYQIVLNYPLKAGAQAAEAQGRAICGMFKRGSTFISSGIRVLIDNSPYMSTGRPEGGWYVKPISIPYVADIYG